MFSDTVCGINFVPEACSLYKLYVQWTHPCRHWCDEASRKTPSPKKQTNPSGQVLSQPTMCLCHSSYIRVGLGLCQTWVGLGSFKEWNCWSCPSLSMLTQVYYANMCMRDTAIASLAEACHGKSNQYRCLNKSNTESLKLSSWRLLDWPTQLHAGRDSLGLFFTGTPATQIAVCNN